MIAKRAGFGNATVYRHFADRRSLLHAVLLFTMSQLARPLFGIDYRDADARRRLDLLLDGLRVFASSGPVAPTGADGPACCLCGLSSTRRSSYGRKSSLSGESFLTKNLMDRQIGVECHPWLRDHDRCSESVSGFGY